MDVKNLSGPLNKIFRQIVDGKGPKAKKGQGSFIFEPGDTFVGSANLGKVLASATHGDIPVQQASQPIGKVFEAFAKKNLAA